MEKRKHIDDICIGDRFLSDDGLKYEVMRFHGSTYVFCECDEEKFDSYFLRSEDLRKRINEFYMRKSDV